MTSSKTPLIIVGANGFLGKNLSAFASQFMDVYCLDSNQFEIPNNLPESSVFIYLRAISSPTFVEANPVISNNVNVNNASKFINQALILGHRVIFASSDIVYGNSSTKIFSEIDEVNPWGLYAKQKSEIEKTFTGHDNFLALRLSLITGEGSKLERILSVETPPKITQGIVRNPINIEFVLKSIKTLIKIRSFRSQFPSGCLNIGGKESVEIFELALRISKNMGFASPVKVHREIVDLDARPAITRISSTIAEDFVGLEFRA